MEALDSVPGTLLICKLDAFSTFKAEQTCILGLDVNDLRAANNTRVILTQPLFTKHSKNNVLSRRIDQELNTLSCAVSGRIDLSRVLE
jgi:hypothetical protein